MATTSQIRAEAQSVQSEAGGELTTRVAIILGAADEIDRLSREKKARIYYQSIVYDVCNIIDKQRGDGRRVVCGTLETPSDDVQKTLAALFANTEPLF